MKQKNVFLEVKSVTTSCEEVCRIHEHIPFNEESIDRIADKLGAISNPTRLKIILLAMKYGEITTCELEKALSLSQSKVSYHLLNLLNADIVDRRTYGPWSFYRVKDKAEISNMFRVIGTDKGELQSLIMD